MDGLKKNWDRAILTLVGLAAIGLAGWFVLKALKYPDTFLMEEAKQKNEQPEPDVASVLQARDFLDKEYKWVSPLRGPAEKPKPLPLFVSVRMIEINGTLIDPLDPKAPPIRPPASNDWILNNGLDILDGGVLNQDPDKDEYTNLEEWNAKTGPRDPASHPPYTDKLFFVSRKQQNYLLQFLAMPDDQRFSLVRLPSSLGARLNFMAKLGDTSPDGMIRLESIERKEGLNALGIKVDQSVLTVTYLPTGEKFTLVVKGQPLTIPTYYGVFRFELGGGTELPAVKKGDPFALPIDPGTKYKLVDIQEQEAEISTEPEPGTEVKLKIKPKN